MHVFDKDVAGYEKLLSEYAALQANPSTTIYNGRRAPDGPETVAPPIYMYHPIFSNFYKFLAEAPSQLTTDHLRKTQKFMTCAEVLWTEDEWLYHTTWKCLDEILGTAISEEDDPFSCGVEAVTVGGVRVRFLIAELERELLVGNNDSDPTTKVGLSFKRTWIQRDVCLLFYEYKASHISKHRKAQSVNFVTVPPFVWQEVVPGFVFWVGC